MIMEHMEEQKLEATILYAAIINACTRLIEQKECLNAINIFPVADGDTGDNMASTAMAIITSAKAHANLSATLKSISEAAISGARGNSGMIFSQFFNGLYKHFQGEDALCTKSFSDLVTLATKSVRQSILNPVEGTILTIMDTWAQQISHVSRIHQSFKSMIKASLSPLDEALNKTQDSLEVLRKAHLVDAGALGFYHFIKGFAEYIESPGEIPKERVHSHKLIEAHDHESPSAPPERRYCTEALLSADEIDLDGVSKLLNVQGDSVVLSSNGQLCRFHLHCNDPKALFLSLTALGKLSLPKVDDMLRQYQVLHQRKYSIALVTDSSANLPKELIDHYQIHVIPLQLYLDEHQLLDHYCIEQTSLYDLLKTLKQYPKTSMPNLVNVREKLHHLSRHYEHVIVVSLSQALSGTHNVFVQAGTDRDNIHVIDSKHTAGAQGLLLKHAAECIEQGMSIERIKQSLIKKAENTHIYVMIEQFDSLIRSGRISKIGGMVAQFAHVKPILTMKPNGSIGVLEKTFSWQKGLHKILQQALKLKNKYGSFSYNILHTNIPDEAEAFAQLATEVLGQAPLYIDTASSAIGLHIGCGAIALSITYDIEVLCEPA